MYTRCNGYKLVKSVFGVWLIREEGVLVGRACTLKGAVEMAGVWKIGASRVGKLVKNRKKKNEHI